ncbi:hypothetical protein KFK09_015681 [Dendrobium nobile]|uniref:Uncharacterized protein n=1 Tax=Dendrobium nobile TaxID=94219 RepID=A0A8T3B6P7_DENNO|nr:hypothetical protein KFK09_015681 [Dendrobium nobile]
MANSNFPPTDLQLTFFRCGGVCLGTAIHHTAADGLGSLHFINSWARITHSDTHIPVLPSVNRTILRARSPPSITSTTQIDCYTTQSTQSAPSSTNPPFTSAILKLSNHHLSLLKTTPNKNNPKPPLSTFKAVVSHIWRSACKPWARPILLDSNLHCRRHPYPPASASPRRLPGQRRLPHVAKATAGEVLSELGAAAKIDDAVKALDDEFIRSLVDYLEEKVNDVGLRKDGWVMPQTDLWVVSWMGMPVYEADFGWGKPVYMGRACMQFGGLAYLMPSLAGGGGEGGGVSVVMTMEEGKMGRFKEIFYEDIGSAAYPPIEILEKGLVIPSVETPAEDIWLSNLDLLAVRSHTATVYFYRRPFNDAGFFSPETLKATLARTLVSFYPLAGRLVSGTDGRLCIRCTAEGVLFVVARSESAVEDFGDFAPSDELRRLLVPFADGSDPANVPLVMFQLTLFRCGGVCLGTAIHHTAADGLASIHFINSWARITHTNTHILIPPSLDHTLLCARSPPSIASDHIEYSQIPFIPSSTLPTFPSAILKLSNHHLALLKITPNNNNNQKTPLSTFKAVVFHIWRSACKARGLDPSSLTRLYIIVDARNRLRPPLPAGYLGNAVFRTSARAKAGEVSEIGVGKIEAALNVIDDEYIRSLVDYLEEKVDGIGAIRPRAIAWVLPETDLWVVSWMGMPVYDADFGWGKPFYMGAASLQVAGQAFIVPCSPEEEEGGVSVVMAMEESYMRRFKEVFYKDIIRGAGSTHA